MARYECARCGVTCHTTEPAHLCKDVKRRHERRERMAAAVEGILLGYGLRFEDNIGLTPTHRQAAENIVSTLMDMGVHEDI